MIISALLALLLTIILIVIVSAIAKSFIFKKNGENSPHFKIKKTLYLDSKRRIVIVQDKNIDYVILLGPNNDILLETRSD
jgi:hypothetical protein